MTDYHLGPLFRFIPSAVNFVLGLLKLTDGGTGTIEATMAADHATSAVSTADQYSPHNQQNNWWYTGAGDVIAWEARSDQPSGLPIFYYQEYKIQDISGGTPLGAGAIGTDFYFISQYGDELQMYYCDLTDTDFLDTDGSYFNFNVIATLSLSDCILTTINWSELPAIDTQLDIRGPGDTRFLDPAFNADCSAVNIGIGPVVETIYTNADPSATCATIALSAGTPGTVTPFIWDGGFAAYDNTTTDSITALPVASTWNPSISTISYTPWVNNHGYLLGDTVHSTSTNPDTWQAANNGTSSAGPIAWYTGGIPNATVVEGGITWNYIGKTYDGYNPSAHEIAVQHMSAEIKGIGEPPEVSDAAAYWSIVGTAAEFYTLEDEIAAALSLGPAHSLVDGPTAFATVFHNVLAPQYPYIPAPAGAAVLGADPAFIRIAKMNWNDGVNDHAYYLSSGRAMFTYFGSRPLSASVNHGDKGYTGVIPIGWTLSGGSIVEVDIRQSQAENYSGSATGTSGRRGQFGRTSNTDFTMAGSFLDPYALADFTDALSADGSYTTSRDLITPHKSGIYINGVLQAELYPLEPDTVAESAKAFQRDIDYNLSGSGSVTYESQTTLSPNQLTFDETETVSYRRARQQILGWNYSGKIFYVERAEMTTVLTTETVTDYTHIAEYRINGALAHSRSFLWGENARIYDFDLSASGFGYCYTLPIVAGGEILFSTFHSFSDYGGIPSEFGSGSTANADQFNWVITSGGVVISSINFDSGTVVINAALNNDVTREHIALAPYIAP